MSRIDENPFEKKIRWRNKPTGFRPWGVGVRYEGIFNDPIKYEQFGPELCEAQYTESEGHPFWSDIKDFKGIKQDMGGDFLTLKWTCEFDKTIKSANYVELNSSGSRLWQHSGHRIGNISDYYNGSGIGWGYITKNTPIDQLSNYFGAKSETDDKLLARGTTAIARTRPDVSPASVTQFLVELKRDGIPFAAKLSREEFKRLLKQFERKGVAKGGTKTSSDYFLENQFGLIPFVSDMKSFSRVALHGLSVLDNLQKNSGELIRRRYTFPRETFSSTQGHGSANPAFGFNSPGSEFLENYGYQDTTVSTVRDTWFSGAYRIWMPTDNEPVSRLQEVANKMRWDYGLDLDFSILWNLAPWTWLIDWQSNLGDVIQNFAKWSDDAVVLHYGYVMQKTVTTYSTPELGSIRNAEPDGTLRPMQLIATKKRRLRATPYGFGFAFDSLSVKQKAILAAIGITRF